MSAGRGAGVQTWAQREDRVRRVKAGGRLFPPCGHLTPLPTRPQAGRAGECPGQGLHSWGLGPVSSGPNCHPSPDPASLKQGGGTWQEAAPVFLLGTTCITCVDSLRHRSEPLVSIPGVQTTLVTPALGAPDLPAQPPLLPQPPPLPLQAPWLLPPNTSSVGAGRLAREPSWGRCAFPQGVWGKMSAQAQLLTRRSFHLYKSQLRTH